MTLREILSSGLFLQSIGTVGLLFTKKKASPAAEPDKNNEVASPLERLRVEHSVRLIEKKDEGLGIDSVAPGTYGWTFAPAKASPMYATRPYQSFEMHKAADGTVYLIGFVTEAEAKAAEVTLFPEPYGTATTLVSLPMSRVNTRNRQPSRKEGNWLKVSVQQQA